MVGALERCSQAPAGLLGAFEHSRAARPLLPTAVASVFPAGFGLFNVKLLDRPGRLSASTRSQTALGHGGGTWKIAGLEAGILSGMSRSPAMIGPGRARRAALPVSTPGSSTARVLQSRSARAVWVAPTIIKIASSDDARRHFQQPSIRTSPSTSSMPPDLQSHRVCPPDLTVLRCKADSGLVSRSYP